MDNSTNKKDKHASDKDNKDDIVLEDLKDGVFKDNDDTHDNDKDAKLKKIKKDLEKCLKERKEYLDGWQRERATLVNLKKEFEQDKKKTIKYAQEQIISDILPVLDSFNMAFSNKDVWESIDETWRKGVEYIYDQLNTVLSRYGVKEFTDLGEKFDPERHHSQEMVEVKNEKDDGKIIEVIQKGYIADNSVLRPAVVKVGKYKKDK